MAVDYDTFVSTVQEEANVPREEAERAVEATLRTLAERISLGEIEDIKAELPEPLHVFMHDGHDPEGFSLGEFVHRVAEREGVKEELAKEHARAVFAALARSVSQKELDDMAAQLSSDYAEVLDTAVIRKPSVPDHRWSVDEFLDRFTERSGLDRDAARRFAEATLEMLAIRVSAGEMDDVAYRLPPELRPPIDRGKTVSHGAAKPLDLRGFLEGIAERTGMTEDDVRRHARAFFVTFREAIGEQEFRDLFDQLPDEYAAVTGHP